MKNLLRSFISKTIEFAVPVPESIPRGHSWQPSQPPLRCFRRAVSLGFLHSTQAGGSTTVPDIGNLEN
jgi:hypothetical protein